MAEAVLEHMPKYHIIIKTAAVSDYRPRHRADHKIKKAEAEQILELIQTQDILKSLGSRKTDQILVGFAAETRELEENAQKKLAEKNLDMIVGNLVNHPASGFGTDTNRVSLFYKDGTKEQLPLMSKDSLAHVLLDRIRDHALDEKSLR